MTAKEKAKSLIERFVEYVKSNDFKSDGSKRTGRWGGSVIKENAKACALICVEEILASSDHAGGGDDYWNQVKQEILNL